MKARALRSAKYVSLTDNIVVWYATTTELPLCIITVITPYSILHVYKNTRQVIKALFSRGFSCVIVFPTHNHNVSQKYSYRNVY